MKQKMNLIALLLILMIGNVFAANFQVTVNLKNGDIISGKSTFGNILLKSKYGDLSIPSEEISNITFGVFSDWSKAAQVNQDLKKLQMSSDNEAKVIYNKLLEMGAPILSIVNNYTLSDIYEIGDANTYSIDNLLIELYEKAGLSIGDALEDVVEFGVNANKMEGSLVLAEIKITNNYGAFVFKKDDISSIKLSVIDEKVYGNNTFKLKANVNISGNDANNAWLDTGIKVSEGQEIKITANGKIKLYSLSGGIYSPSGYASGPTDASYDESAEIPYGSVVYKIGTADSIHKVVSNEIFTAPNKGTLYLCIYETVFNDTNVGSYIVKVDTKK